ncbi:SIMPL domain-containing protein [Planctomycetota bacterium]
MQRVLLMYLVVSIITGAALAEPELKGTPSELTAYLSDIPKYVRLSGTSELKMQADHAKVEISVKTKDDLLQNALKLNQDLRGKIEKSLNSSGISSDKIAASRFSSTPRYGFFSTKPTSYEVTNLVKITIEKEKDFQEIAEIVDSYKEVEYSGISFEHSDKDQLKRKALEQTCDDVNKKKLLYETKFGVKLEPKSFIPSDIEESGKVAEGIYLRSYGRGVYNKLGSSVHQEAPDEVEAAASPFGELIFTGYITVEYQLINMK